MGPDAEPCGHLASGEVPSVSLGLHGVCSPPFYCSGSRSGLYGHARGGAQPALVTVQTLAMRGEQWIPRSDWERVGADPRFPTATLASRAGRPSAHPQVHHGWRAASHVQGRDPS
jgi:hypothetical protein